MEQKKAGRPKKDRMIDVSLNRLDEPIHVIRQQIDPQLIEDLAISIAQVGLIEPLVVRQHGDRFEIIAGHRRYLALRRAGKKYARCMIVTKDDDLVEVMRHHENMFRVGLSAVDEAYHFGFLMSSLGLSQKDVADLMGCSEGYVSQRQAILGWDACLREAVADRKISFTSARELSRVTDLEVLKGYVEQAVAHGITPRVANSWRQQWEATQGIAPKMPAAGPPGAADQQLPELHYPCGLCKAMFPFDQTHYVRLCEACFKLVEDVARQESSGKVREYEGGGR